MTSIELLKQDLDAELKLGTKMVVNWDMYIEMHKQEMEKIWFDSTLQFDNSAEMTHKKSFEQYYQETFNK
jgi:hypothetical protein